MYSGHLTEKKGYFYCVITYKTSEGKRKEKWFSTKLPVKGNKRRAEALLQEYRRTFVPPKEDRAFDALDSTMPFTAYMRLWLDYAKPTVAPTTVGGYQSTIEKKFIPYFERLNLTLQEVKPKHLQSFYLHELKTLSATTVRHEHTLMHRLLKYAYRMAGRAEAQPQILWKLLQHGGS